MYNQPLKIYDLIIFVTNTKTKRTKKSLKFINVEKLFLNKIKKLSGIFNEYCLKRKIFSAQWTLMIM